MLRPSSIEVVGKICSVVAIAWISAMVGSLRLMGRVVISRQMQSARCDGGGE